MSERKEPGLNLSGIEVDEQGAQPVVRAAAPVPKPRGSGVLLTLILLLLAAAVARAGILEPEPSADAH